MIFAFWASVVILYLIIGTIFEYFGDGDGVLIFIWPLVAALFIVVGPFFLVKLGHEKLPKLYRNFRDRNKPPTPTQVVQGIVETVLIRHFENWGRAGSQLLFKHKNISIIKGYGGSTTVLISDDTLPINDKLQGTIDQSINLWKQKEEERKKFELEHRMLDNLQEFLEIKA